MIPHVETYKGTSYFQNDLLLYVNRASEEFSIPLHNHDFIELAYVTEGTGFHHIQDEVLKARKGELFLIPVGIPHVFRPLSSDPSKNPLIVYNCVFSPLLLDKFSEFSTDAGMTGFLSSLRNGSEPIFSCMDADDRFQPLFMSLHREYSFCRDGYSDYLYSLLLQLLVELYRVRRCPMPESAPRPSHFADLLRYIEKNYQHEITLTVLSDISLWSERHLQRLFQRHTGQSFHRYLQSFRMQKSCELLRSTQLKISMVAEMAGYQDFGSFVAVFKRNTGMTPSQYRKANLSNT